MGPMILSKIAYDSFYDYFTSFFYNLKEKIRNYNCIQITKSTTKTDQDINLTEESD